MHESCLQTDWHADLHPTHIMHLDHASRMELIFKFTIIIYYAGLLLKKLPDEIAQYQYVKVKYFTVAGSIMNVILWLYT